MKNQWTEEVDKLRLINKELLEACRDALLLPPLVEKLEWLKRHEDDLRSDCNEGSIEDQKRQINHIMDELRAAIKAAEVI